MQRHPLRQPASRTETQWHPKLNPKAMTPALLPQFRFCVVFLDSERPAASNDQGCTVSSSLNFLLSWTLCTGSAIITLTQEISARLRGWPIKHSTFCGSKVHHQHSQPTSACRTPISSHCLSLLRRLSCESPSLPIAPEPFTLSRHPTTQKWLLVAVRTAFSRVATPIYPKRPVLGTSRFFMHLHNLKQQGYVNYVEATYPDGPRHAEVWSSTITSKYSPVALSVSPV